MKIAVIAFSACGAKLTERLEGLAKKGHEINCYIAASHAVQTNFEPFASITEYREAKE